MPIDKQEHGPSASFLDRISLGIATVERSFDEWIVEREGARAREWMARYWPDATAPLPDTKYVWPHVFKYRGHRAMLVTGYPEKGSSWDDLRVFYGRESIVVRGETFTPPAWFPLVKATDRRSLGYSGLVLLLKAVPALASLLRMRFLFNNSFRLLIKRPLVLFLVAPGPRARTVCRRDAEEAVARDLTVVCDATGIACSGSFDDSRTQLTGGAIEELCAWALAAAGRAISPDDPRHRPEGAA